MPKPMVAIAYSKILKTSFGMADLDKADKFALEGTLIRFRHRRNETRALSLTLPRAPRSKRSPTALLEPQRHAEVSEDVFRPAQDQTILRQRQRTQPN
jgi:hypothetical protein